MKKKKRKDAGWYALFTVPLLFVFATIVLIPFFIGVGYSFFSWDGLPLNPKIFVGMKNFVHLFSDSRFMTSAGHTVIFTVFSVLLINVIGLAFALIVTTKLKVRNVARAMLFMPYLIGSLFLATDFPMWLRRLEATVSFFPTGFWIPLCQWLHL